MKCPVILIDDHPILTAGLKAMLENEVNFQVIGIFNNANFALSFLKSTKSVKLILLDHSMPDMTGIAFINQVKKLENPPKIIMLSMHDESVIIKEAISAGADGYVLKKSVSDELILAMETVMSGKPYWSAEVSQKLFQKARDNDYSVNTLTDREVEVLRLIVKELTNKEIAKNLFISERTVEVHRKNMMRKVNTNNTVGLIKYAYAQGYV
ncbi:MAG TPA: response regulator transcription factor [Sphingobacteriaceae bacterium]|nr:response regulator transcription factor [Sphingobacteriaceae bacterium]